MATATTRTTSDQPEQPEGAQRSGLLFGSWLALLITAAAHAVLVALQPILAGVFLAGSVPAIELHGANAGFIHLVAVPQVIAAAVYWRAAHRAWPFIAAVVIWVAEGAQFPLGELRILVGHIPLGIALLTSTVLYLIWVCLPSARRAKPRRTSPSSPPDVQPLHAWTGKVLTGVAWFTVVTMLLQPVLAGLYFDGTRLASALHAANANLVGLAALIQLVMTILFRRPGPGRLWPSLLALLLFFGVVSQYAFGYARTLELHVPLGVALAVAQLTLAILLPTSLSRRKVKRS